MSPVFIIAQKYASHTGNVTVSRDFFIFRVTFPHHDKEAVGILGRNVIKSLAERLSTDCFYGKDLNMPTGILINVASVALGGLLGTLAGHKMSVSFKENLNMIFGVCAMTMGISSIALMVNMPAVIFAVIIGTAIGLVLHFGEWISKGAVQMEKVVSRILPQKESDISEKEFRDTLITIIVLFCASGTGIYGSILSGMTGDQSILISKSILDFFTAMIFACILGLVVSFIAIPQLIIFMILFLLAGVIYPLTTPDMINDFKACGGVLLLATGFRMIKVKMFPTADMIPAMILVMPCSWVWATYILPLVS